MVLSRYPLYFVPASIGFNDNDLCYLITQDKAVILFLLQTRFIYHLNAVLCNNQQINKNNLQKHLTIQILCVSLFQHQRLILLLFRDRRLDNRSLRNWRY